MSAIPDQKALWNGYHERGVMAELSYTPSSFATSIENELPPRSHILELGCGSGGDARYFAKLGHQVIATDFSEVVIEQNKQHPADSVDFRVMDMSQPMPFDDAAFDIAYAHLSLHYYSDVKTKEIVSEISRVLKSRGRFFFRCKSVHSSEYGVGDEIEENTFVSNGHVRHLFTVEYAREILGGLFDVDKVERGHGDLYGREADFVDCWATKQGENYE